MKIVDKCGLRIEFRSGKYADFKDFLMVKAKIDYIIKKIGETKILIINLNISVWEIKQQDCWLLVQN